jgi:hypothetical protein
MTRRTFTADSYLLLYGAELTWCAARVADGGLVFVAALPGCFKISETRQAPAVHFGRSTSLRHVGYTSHTDVWCALLHRVLLL